jgi:hypothetical protein
MKDGVLVVVGFWNVIVCLLYVFLVEYGWLHSRLALLHVEYLCNKNNCYNYEV